MHQLMKSLLVLPLVVAAGTVLACRDAGPEPSVPVEVPAPGAPVTLIDPWQVGIVHNAILHEAISTVREARRDPARWAALRADPCGAAGRAVGTQAGFAAAALHVAPADIMLAAEFQRATDPECGGDPAAAERFASRFRSADARLRASGAKLSAMEAAELDAVLRQQVGSTDPGTVMARLQALQTAADGPVTPSRFVVASMASLGSSSSTYWRGADVRYPTDRLLLESEFEGAFGPGDDILAAASADLSACSAAVAFVRRWGVSDPRLLAAACLGAGGAASAAYGYNLLK